MTSGNVFKFLLANILLFFSLQGLFAQRHPILGKFYLSENKGTVDLHWSIMEGSTCNGIQIYRSNDSIQFSKIGEISGVCGSISEEQSYTFSDVNPFRNQVNYYRLELGIHGFFRGSH